MPSGIKVEADPLAANKKVTPAPTPCLKFQVHEETSRAGPTKALHLVIAT